MHRSRLAAIVCVLAILAATAAQAQLPEKGLRLIVPFGGGGGIDSAARNLAQGMQQQLNRPVIVENRPGANSVIGAKAVADSAPDGNTMLFTSGSTVAVLPSISKDLPFDPQNDLVAVGKVARLPFLLVVHQSVGAASFQEFLARAKAAPGKLTYASAGSGTGSHLGFELLKRDAGIDVTHIPYKATAEALPDLLTGRVTSMMADPATARRAIADAAVRALAVTTKDRASGFPAVPTVAEQGLANFDLQLWFGVFVPRGTPEAVIARLNAAIGGFLRTPEGAAVFDKLGFTVDHTSPQALTALARRENAQWADLVRSGALKAE